MSLSNGGKCALYEVNPGFKEIIKQKILKCKKKSVKITKEDIKEVIKLFDLLKLPYIQTTYEADIVCSYLVKEKITDGCITNDNDLLCYQCPLIYKDINFINKTVKVVDINKLCNILKLNLNQLTFFLTLFGCDYSSKIRYENLNNIYKLLLNGLSNSEILKQNNYINKENIQNAYKIFTYMILFDKNKNIENFNYIKTKYNIITVDKKNNFFKNLKFPKEYNNQIDDYVYYLKNYINIFYIENNLFDL